MKKLKVGNQRMNKQKLWIFGDSYSIPWRFPTKNDKPPKFLHLSYVKWYFDNYGKMPIHFSDVISEYFGIDENNVINKSIGGSCNYTILETIGNNISNISKDDVVVIGWSEVSRFRVFERHKNKTVYFTNYPSYEPLSKDTKKQMVLRNNQQSYNEIRSWQNILKRTLPTNTIFWTPFTYNKKYKIPFLHFNKSFINIEQETNGEIVDGHYGSDVHQTIGKEIINQLNYNNFI